VSRGLRKYFEKIEGGFWGGDGIRREVREGCGLIELPSLPRDKEGVIHFRGYALVLGGNSISPRQFAESICE